MTLKQAAGTNTWHTFWLTSSLHSSSWPILKDLSAPSSNPDADRRGIPYSIPSDQLYYWTQEWQEGVRLAKADIESGDYVDFDSEDPNDIVHWLYGVDGE